MIIFSFIIYFAKVVGGFMLAHLIWNSRDSKTIVFKFFLGTGIGTGLSSLFYFLWSWWKFPVVVFPYIELVLFILLLIVNFTREQKNRVEKKATSFAIPSRPTLVWTGLVILAVIFCVFAFMIRSIQAPHGLQDAWAIWNLSARFIYGGGENWIQIIPQNAWFHSDYPLLTSLNIAESWSILGTNTTRVPITFALIYVLSIIGLLYSSLMLTKDYEQGALGAIVIASVPMLQGLGSIQYADAPLSYFILATGALLYIYTLLHETRLFIFVGLFAGLAGWTKNEGLMFIAITILLCLALSLRERKNLFKHFAAGLFFPIVVIALFKSIAPPSDLFVNKVGGLLQVFDFSRYQIISFQIIKSLLSFGGWPVSLVLIIMAYAFLVWAKPYLKGQIWIPFLMLLFQFASYFLIYLITPYDLVNHLKNSLDRLLFQIFPLTIFLILNLLPSPREILMINTLAKE
jgi:hypothetical protein